MREQAIKQAIAVMAFLNAVTIATTPAAQAFWNWNRPNSRPSPYQLTNRPAYVQNYVRQQPTLEQGWNSADINPPAGLEPYGVRGRIDRNRTHIVNGLINRRTYQTDGNWQSARLAERQSYRALKSRFGFPKYQNERFAWYQGPDGRWVRFGFNSEGRAVEVDFARRGQRRMARRTNNNFGQRVVRRVVKGF